MQHLCKSCSTVSTDGKNVFISSRKALSTNATSGSGRIPGVFTTPSASVCSQAQSNVGTDEGFG